MFESKVMNILKKSLCQLDISHPLNLISLQLYLEIFLAFTILSKFLSPMKFTPPIKPTKHKVSAPLDAVKFQNIQNNQRSLG